jgi:hypothetical protein
LAADVEPLTARDGSVRVPDLDREALGERRKAASTGPSTAYGIGSARWKQVQEAEGRPGELDRFLKFAKATTPSLTESLYTEDGAKQAYVVLVETTL